MLDILSALRGHSEPLLADTMADFSNLQKAILHDFEGYHTSKNQSVYSLSSYAVKKATIDNDKLRKHFKLDIRKDDPEKIVAHIRGGLRKYVLKHIKRCHIVLLPELGKRNSRLHFHGYFNGDHLYLEKIAKWWNRNIGFCDTKVITGDAHRWFDYIKPICREIYIFKENRRIRFDPNANKASDNSQRALVMNK